MVTRTKIKQLIYISILFCFSSCMTEAGCKRGMEFLGKHEANIVLYQKPRKSYETYELICKDLATGRDTTIGLRARWYEQLYYIWDVGDTVIKKKDELIITIRKKDNTVHWSEWTCEGIYVDGKSVSTGVPQRRKDTSVRVLE